MWLRFDDGPDMSCEAKNFFGSLFFLEKHVLSSPQQATKSTNLPQLQLGNEMVHVSIILVSHSMYEYVQFVLGRFKNHVIVSGAHINNA